MSENTEIGQSSTEEIKLPPELQLIAINYAKAVIKNNPENIISFSKK